jgi:hypothetical protein
MVARPVPLLLLAASFASPAETPAVRSVTADQVRSGIKVVSGRSHALLGYNRPKVQVHLPRALNSHYSVVTFEPPALSDAAGRAVSFEVERGLYSEQTFADEIRFVRGDTIVEFARAVGTVRVRYPLEIATLAVTARDAARAKSAGVVISAGRVTFSRAGRDVPEPPTFSELSPIRAFDGAGKRLEMESPVESSLDQAGVEHETRVFNGQVARVEIDHVTRWLDLSARYELPPSPRLPPEGAGLAPPARAVADTPGGKVTLTVDAGPAALPREEAVAQLKALGFPNPADADQLIGNALQGREDVVGLFLAAGLHVDTPGRHGDRAFLMALRGGYVDLAGDLLAAGADPTLADSNGLTPLIELSPYCDESKLLGALIGRGVDVNARTRGGLTALQGATRGRCAENVRLLKQAGAKP